MKLQTKSRLYKLVLVFYFLKFKYARFQVGPSIINAGAIKSYSDSAKESLVVFVF